MNAQTMSAQPNLGMQPTTFENPMGIDGFEFVEFAAPAGQGELLHDYFRDGLHRRAAPQDAPDHRVPPGRREFPGQRGSGQLRRRLRRAARPQRLRLRDPLQEAGRRRVRDRAQQRRRSDHRQGRQQGRRRAGGQGHRRLHAVPGRPLRRRRERCTSRLRADPGRRPEPEGVRPDLHRPPHPQPVLRQHAEVVGLLRAAVQLPRDPLLRHQGRQDRPGVQGDDRAGRHRAHPAQRIQRPEVADQRIPRRLQGRGHPAHRLLHRRHLRRPSRRCARRASSSSTRRTPTST